MGIFTYNFLFMLSKRIPKSIRLWKDIIKDEEYVKIWNKIKMLADQSPFIIWN